MMNSRSFLRSLILLFLLASLPLTQIACTSSDDEDVSVLEEELETMGDGEMEMADDIGDEELMDVVEGDDASLSDLDGDSEFADDEFSDEEFSEGGKDEFADSGGGDEFSEEEFSDDEFASEGGDEFDEFAELDEGGGKDPFAQDEEALAKELGKGEDYPVAKDAQPQFPEEVIGKNGATNTPPMLQGDPIPPPGGVGIPGQPLPPTTGALVTSETELIDLPDPIEPTIPQDDLGMADPIVPDDSDMPEEPSWVPVQKIKTNPYFENKKIMNAVYIVRPGDTMASISEKIYGQDRSSELLADNTHLEKGIDPGDKVYYNSPNRSEDNENLKFYYDDIGLPAQTYRTKKNDNMRRLGTKLLGFAEGWKELWAINPNVDSKTIVPAGLELRYWTGNESKPQMEMAEATTPEDTPTQPTETFTADPEPIGDPNVATGTTEDPFGDTSELEPEPPLPEAEVSMAPDPALAPEPAELSEISEGVEEAPIPPPQVGSVQRVDNDGSLLSIGAIALLILAGVGLVAIQIKKRKDATAMSPGSLEYTQV